MGKAKNLRSRVRAYFYGDDRRSVDQMLRDLVAIDHRVCATELEASITEVRLIHAHVPRAGLDQALGLGPIEWEPCPHCDGSKKVLSDE